MFHRFTTLITAGTGFYRNDDLGIAVQVEYSPGTGQYKALIHNRWGGSVFSWSNPLIVDLDHETGISGGMFTLVDVVASPSGEKVLSIGLDSPTFNRTYLINNFTRLAPKIVPFEGAATVVTYQGYDAVYAARDNDGIHAQRAVNL